MAENRPERPGAETGTTPSADDAGPVVPKARTPETEPTAERRRPSPRRRAKKASPAKATEPEPAANEPAADEPAANEPPADEPAADEPAKAAAKQASRKTAEKAAKTARQAPKKTARQAPKKAARQAPKKAAEPLERAEPVEPPAERAELAEPPVPGGPHPAAPGVWAAAWEALRSDPERAPRRFAELAVAELGPRAAAWVEWLRQTYPGAPAEGIVRLAARQAGRTGRGVALARVGGPVAAALCVPAEFWVRASVVLRIAAAYGHDPTDPRRVPELLELLRPGPAATAGPEDELVAEEPSGAGGSTGARVVSLIQWLNLLRPLVASPRLLRRASPLAVASLLAGVSEHSYSIERLAHRAARFYRPGSQSSTAASARSSSSAYKP